MKQTIKVGIIGGAGYTAGELIRILLHHPRVEIIFVQSKSNAGNLISDIHTDLIEDIEDEFVAETDYSTVDVVFICSGHGKTRDVLGAIPEHVKIIDLSQDFRLKRDENDFVYGLPELNWLEIRKANHIANPGCFATGIQLALLPLASAELLVDEVHVNAITGSTGAGQEPTDTTHFSWREGNISIYKAFEHQHLKEIHQSIQQLQLSFDHDINFIPVRGNFTRGIFVTVYTKFDGTIEMARLLFHNYYDGQPFVYVVDKNPNLKQVVNTNKCFLYLEKHGDKLLIVSIIDNLIKGSSGQAVHNMNLLFGIDEEMGLKSLKAVAF